MTLPEDIQKWIDENTWGHSLDVKKAHQRGASEMYHHLQSERDKEMIEFAEWIDEHRLDRTVGTKVWMDGKGYIRAKTTSELLQLWKQSKTITNDTDR